MRVHAAGRGPAVFLHGPWGLAWEPFLDGLASASPCTRPSIPAPRGRPGRHLPLDSLWDLVLCYDEVFDAAAIANGVIGHSFGGMVAWRWRRRRRARAKLVLINPIGLWRDDAPVVNWMLLIAAGVAGPRCSPTRAGRRPRCSVPDDPEDAAQTRTAWVAWYRKVHLADPRQGPQETHPPHQRVHTPRVGPWRPPRPLVYADEFARRLSGRDSRSKNVAHFPHLEQPEAVAGLVESFLKG